MRPIIDTATDRTTCLGLFDLATFVFVLSSVYMFAVFAPTAFNIFAAVIFSFIWVCITFMREDLSPYFPVDTSMFQKKCSGGSCSLVPPSILSVLQFVGGFAAITLIVLLWGSAYSIFPEPLGFSFEEPPETGALVMLSMFCGSIGITLLRFSVFNVNSLIRSKIMQGR